MSQTLGDLLHKLGAQQPDTTPDAAAPPTPAVPPGRQSLEPKGYSEHFAPVRTLISSAHYDEALRSFDPGPEPTAIGSTKVICKDVFLANVEGGLLEFEAGNFDEAGKRFSKAEDVVAPKAQPKKGGMGNVFGAIGKGVGKIAGVVVGQGEIGPYGRMDHEEILQLNYLAMSYLLKGDHKCYNVTRRCISEQSVLKLKFETQLADYKSKLGAQTSDKTKLNDADRQSLDKLSTEFQSYDTIATRVPNAYVNPLGDYLSGVIQEIAALEQPPLRSNSRISYANAATLSGRSPQMTAAAIAMARPSAPPTERVAHVIVAEGFAPTRLVMTYGIALKGQVVPIRVPIFAPVASGIDTVEVQGPTGARLARLDPIGDVESIVLRSQHDRIPMIMLGVMLNSVASFLAAEEAKRLGSVAQLAVAFRNAYAEPDTRSWSGLPRRFHVARVVLPPRAASIRLAVTGAAGQRMRPVTIPIDPTETHSVIYARVTDDGLRAQTARRLWIDGQLDMQA